ncbi:MAG: class I SAM-dependent methyltransferase [Brevinematia bacterium]
MKTNKNILKYNEKFIHYYSDFIPHKIRELIDNNNFKIIADIGCGDGALLYAFKINGLLEKFDKIYAVDISEERLERVKKIDNKILTVCDDAMLLEKTKNLDSMDFIVCNQLIEHVPDDDKTIKSISNILKKNGLCYISTVYKKWYGWYFYKNKVGKWVIDPTHEREYTREEQLLNLFEKHNLDVIYENKIIFKFPILDFFLKRVGFKQDVYENNKILKFLRNIKIPILGYYYWEIVAKKK